MIPGPDIDRGEKWRPFGGRVAARRPGMLRWERRFAGTPDQVGAARTLVSELFADAPFAGNAAWITGELATNAIRHSASGRPGGTFTVALCRWPTFGEIHVIDAGGPKEPRLPNRDPVGAAIEEGDDLPESGLGLYGIAALADHYGTYRHRDGTRVVWARLRSVSPGRTNE
ncbi:ATP-binding protein [Actinoallomurus liliacearum]